MSQNETDSRSEIEVTIEQKWAQMVERGMGAQTAALLLVARVLVRIANALETANRKS